MRLEYCTKPSTFFDLIFHSNLPFILDFANSHHEIQRPVRYSRSLGLELAAHSGRLPQRLLRVIMT